MAAPEGRDGIQERRCGVKRATVKQRAEMYAHRCDSWNNAINRIAPAFIAGWKAAQRAARKAKKGRAK